MGTIPVGIPGVDEGDGEDSDSELSDAEEDYMKIQREDGQVNRTILTFLNVRNCINVTSNSKDVS